VAAEPAECEWPVLGRRWILEAAGKHSSRVAEVTLAARGRGVIKTSARPAAEGLRCLEKRAARVRRKSACLCARACAR
jgi:hypothetical protein